MARLASSADTQGKKSPSKTPRRRKARGPGRPKGDQEVARAQIVDVAAPLFAREGYAGTTTSALARAAGVSQGTLFHHFPNKRALLAEVGRREGDRVLSIAFADIDPTAPPPDPAQLIGPLFDYAEREPDAYRLFAMDGDFEDLEAGFASKRSSITTGLARLLAVWSGHGHLPDMDTELVAELVFAVTDAGVRRLVLEDRWDQKAAVLEATCRAIRGILAPDLPSGRPF